MKKISKIFLCLYFVIISIQAIAQNQKKMILVSNGLIGKEYLWIKKPGKEDAEILFKSYQMEGFDKEEFKPLIINKFESKSFSQVYYFTTQDGEKEGKLTLEFLLAEIEWKTKDGTKLEAKFGVEIPFVSQDKTKKCSMILYGAKHTTFEIEDEKGTKTNYIPTQESKKNIYRLNSMSQKAELEVEEDGLLLDEPKKATIILEKKKEKSELSFIQNGKITKFEAQEEE
jgi:hypothetical protein